MDSHQKQYLGSNNLLLSEAVDAHSSDCHRSSSACKRAFFKSFKTLFLVSRFQKYYFIIFRKGLKGKQAILKHDLKSTLAATADMSTKAMVKILTKYNKVHGSKNGQKSGMEFQNIVQLEDLKPPCLCELIAFHMNNIVKEKKQKTTLSGLLNECKFQMSEGRTSLLISPSNSRDIDFDLTCSICLDTFFDPVSLTCGHVFCYMCACSSGSVTTIDGIKAADSTSKCPLCRKEGVFRDAERMSQLHILLKRKLPEYWKERREKERQARIKEAKAYWELQCRAFVGIK